MARQVSLRRVDPTVVGFMGSIRKYLGDVSPESIIPYLTTKKGEPPFRVATRADEKMIPSTLHLCGPGLEVVAKVETGPYGERFITWNTQKLWVTRYIQPDYPMSEHWEMARLQLEIWLAQVKIAILQQGYRYTNSNFEGPCPHEGGGLKATVHLESWKQFTPSLIIPL